MYFEPYQLYNVYNRGNNSQQIFHSHDHYSIFKLKIKEILLGYCEIIAYCLMPNHYHMMVFPVRVQIGKEFRIVFKPDALFHPLVRKIGTLQSSYTRLLNHESKNTGSIFQQKAKSKELDLNSSYPLTCFHYIHQNPYRSELIQTLDQWEYSSYYCYAGYSNDQLINKKLANELLGISLDPLNFRSESESYIINDTSQLFCKQDRRDQIGNFYNTNSFSMHEKGK